MRLRPLRLNFFGFEDSIDALVMATITSCSRPCAEHLHRSIPRLKDQPAAGGQLSEGNGRRRREGDFFLKGKKEVV